MKQKSLHKRTPDCERFEQLVNQAKSGMYVPADLVTESTWREIARLGYQCLDKPHSTYERLAIQLTIEWAESQVDLSRIPLASQ